ncbi:MAG: polysaccharide deacetylase family protein [Candidatus Bathyarchaeia archaeon]|jgi:hypothetical protein
MNEVFSKLPKELFDLYSCREEYGGKRDKYGRFLPNPEKRSYFAKPAVSEYLLSTGLLKPNWPESKRFAACLTHDVDIIYPSLKYSFFTSAKLAARLKLHKSYRRFVGRQIKDYEVNPFWSFRDILALEERYSAKSSFFFKTALDDPVGWTYRIEDLSEELGYISDSGFEVAFHGGFYSFDDADVLSTEKKALEKVLGRSVTGIRMHFLRFEIPDTWKIIKSLGFKYDSTLGFSTIPGFRNGMCHPFFPYDLRFGSEINIIEIPLIIMDTSLFRMPINEAWSSIKNLILAAENCKGVITILWHTNNYDEAYSPVWSKMYAKILDFLNQKGAWMTSGQEICNYWSKNADGFWKH